MPTAHPVANPTTITVYGADWCSDCRRSKRLLVERETDFEWVDVNVHREIRAELTASGYPAIPVIVMPGGLILTEPTDDELAEVLDVAEALDMETAPAG
jgi:glutaredoxin